jgi:hypothetical protein
MITAQQQPKWFVRVLSSIEHFVIEPLDIAYVLAKIEVDD